jgi:2-methylcitrate dehydratase PrpD
MTISQQYAKFVLDLQYEDLPAAVVDKAKSLFLDTMGVAIGGTLSDTRPILGRLLPPYAQTGGCSALSFPDRYLPEIAMLTNAILSHSFDFDDTHNGSMSHPCGALVSCLLAMGEQVPISGRQAITSLVAGYEIVAHLAIAATALGQYARGFHPTGTTGVFGAAALCGKLLHLAENVLAHAFGLAGSCASGLMEWTAGGAMTKRLHPGLAARNGYLAVRLAQSGFTGPKTVIEGRQGFLHAFSEEAEKEKLAARLGAHYEILESQIKLYACNSGFHTAIEGLIRILEENQIQADEIASITAGIRKGTGLTTTSGDNYYVPKTALDSQMSLPYTLAVAAIDRKVGHRQYAEERIHDPRIQELAARVKTPVRQYLVDAYVQDHRRVASDVEVETVTGRKYSTRIDYPRGGPENLADPKEVEGKFRSQAEEVIGEGAATAILEKVGELEKRENIAEFWQWLQARGKGRREIAP